MNIIEVNKKYIPMFGFSGHTDKYPACHYTMLCLGYSGADCAAYEAIGPDMSRLTKKEQADLLNRMASGGNKISEDAARKLFELKCNGQELSYRR